MDTLRAADRFQRAPLSAPRRHKQATRRRSLPATLAVIVAAVFSALFTLHAVTSGSGWRDAFERLDALIAGAGFGIDQVEISGYRFANDAQIFDAVDLDRARSFLTFDARAAKARIEQLSWVDTATVERQLPNRLVITVSERPPFAVWLRGDHDVLIDATGRTLARVAKGRAPDLARVAGEDAAADAARLLGLVSRYHELAQRLSLAERVGGRRWRLQLKDPAMTIELPPEADAAALAMLFEPHSGRRLVDADASVIDLTTLRRVMVRPASRPGKG